MGENTAWKAFERRVARVFNGIRRGPGVGGRYDGGKSDIICEKWSPECALLKQASYVHLLRKAQQSERNAEPGLIPVAIVKRKHIKDADALVVMRLETFARFLVNPGSHAPFGDEAALVEGED